MSGIQTSRKLEKVQLKTLEGFSKELNPVGEPFTQEQMLLKAANAEHLIIEGISIPLPGQQYMKAFRSWQEGNLYHNFRRSKSEIDTYEWYTIIPLRLVWITADLNSILHPNLLPENEAIFMDDFEKPNF